MNRLPLPNVTHCIVGRNIKAVTITNELLSASILVDYGADIHSLVYLPMGIDVLWKTPRLPREPGVGAPPTGDSLTRWIDYYRGGWNLIFPNFGSAVNHRGAPLEFHGEAARLPWSLRTVESSPSKASVELEVSLRRSPFHIRRIISVEAGKPVLSISETITNECEEPMECIWAHHPAFGFPLISGDCMITTSAQQIESDDSYDVAGNDLPLGETWNWPQVTNRRGEEIDLSKMAPEASSHSRVLCLKNFAEGRFSLTNPTLGLGVELSWDRNLFPYANFWQETGGERGYPFYGKAYVMAIEPSSSFPAQGLAAVIDKTATHLTFQPREQKATVILASLLRL